MVFSNPFTPMFGIIQEVIQIISSPSNKEIKLKILLILGYFLTTYNFLILFFHTPKGYVIDIYSVLPLSFFASLIICYTIGSGVIFYNKGIIRKLGIMLLVFTYSAVLIIPYMLGYYSMGRADDMSYIGEYLQISISGNIAGWDIYPASHIFGASLSMLTNLDPHIVSFMIPFVFSFLFAGGLFLFCRLILNDQIFVNIAIPSSFIFYLGQYNFLNVPHALFFAIMPLFLYILFRFLKNPTFSNTILIFPLILLVPFMHPFIFLFVSLILITLIIFSRFLKRFVELNYWQTTHLFIIVIIGFFSWFIFCSNLIGSFRRSYISYLKKITEPVFFETTDKLIRIHLDSYHFLKFGMIYYGRYIIPFLIIIIAMIILYFKWDRIPKILKKRMVLLVYFYGFLLFLELILFFNPIISHQPNRLTNLNFIVYAQVPLFVLSVYVIFIKPKLSIRRVVLLILLLSTIWGLSLFGAFNAPNTFKPNDALSINEIQGMKWFYQTRITGNVLTLITQIERFHDLFADGDDDTHILIPDHFGYINDSRSFSEINFKTGESYYIVLPTVDELAYQKVPGYMEVGRYNADDFRRFRNDNSIIKIFDDLNIEIYVFAH